MDDNRTAGPVPLDDAVRVGATLFGQAVVRLTLVTDDGRKMLFELPRPSGPALSATQTKVLSMLKAAAEPVARKKLASSLGYSDYRGRFAAEVRDLVKRGCAFVGGAGVTDDPRKFPKGKQT